jgi:excisionase family DNA binding protein
VSSELSPPSGFKQLPPVLTSREAAKALRIGVKEIRQLIARGDLAAARIGPRRVIRIAKSALLDVLRGARRTE